ncbi:MAG: hypothetical protein ABWZ40_11340 [Caulobacterales bacterium]
MPNIPFVPEHKLIAYADGFLPPAEMAQIEAALTRSPALAKRVARIKQTRELAAASFDDALAQPLPSGILKAAAGAGINLRRPLTYWQAFAAIGILIAGLLIGRFSVPSAQSPGAPRLAIAAPRGAVAGPELSGFLNTAETGQELIIGDHLPAKMTLSFPAKGGQACRQFQVGAELQMMNAVACRHENEWRIEIIARALEPDPIKATSGLERDPVNVAIDQIIEGAPLDATQERAAIANKWRSAHATSALDASE